MQKALSSQPQLIVMDVDMPDANGLDLCRKIKRDKMTCHIPLILLTFMSSEQDQISSRNGFIWGRVSIFV